MAHATVPTELPARVVAGTTWRWDREVDDYSPADGWALTSYFRGAGKLDVSAVANAANTAWEYTAAATATATLPAGRYLVLEVVSSGTEKFEVGRAWVQVEPNLATQAAGAQQPYEEVLIGKLQAYLTGAADDGILEFQIAGRAVKLISFAEARTMITQLQADLQAKVRRGRRPPIVPVFR